SARSGLEASIRSRKTVLQQLPKIIDPTYLFQVSGKKEYVWIGSARYGFDGHYVVRIGKPGAWREMETLRSVPSAEGPGEVISFRSGGGVSIPSSIDLFAKAAQNRGSPTLIRGKMATSELLVRPRIEPADAAKWGLVRRSDPKLVTPCTRHP